MADFTQDFFSIRRNFADGNTRVGTAGKLWYDSITNSIRISDGHSPGGVLVNGSGGSYTLPTATPSVVGGVQLGANIIATGASIDVLQPTRVSQLENDSNYLSSAVLSGYATQTYVTSQGYVSSAALASGNANVIAANTAIQSISANVGAYQIWANANVSALGSNAGVQSASINRLDANLGTATTNISNLVTQANANTTALLTGSVSTGALTVTNPSTGIAATINVTPYQPVGTQTWTFRGATGLGVPYSSWINFPDGTNQYTAYPGTSTSLSTFDANIGTLSLGNISTQANLGAYQTWANANAATQQTSINNINANVGAFASYANTKIGTNTNSNLVVVSTTGSSSTTTGALVVAGGAGIAGNVNIGGNVQVSGAFIGNVTLGTVPSSPNNLYGVAPLNLVNSQAATLKTQLNLINTGGSGGAGSAIDFYTYTDQGNRLPGARFGAIDDGNYGATFQWFIKADGNTGNNSLQSVLSINQLGNVVVPGTTTSTSTTTGALTIAGGAGIAGNVNIGGNVVVTTTTASADNTSGALVVKGGVGVTGNLNLTYNPTSTIGSAIQLTGKDTQGGTGYFDFLKATNTTSGATNPNKTIRLNSTGSMEVINSAYTTTLMSISDAGFMSVGAGYQVAGKQSVNGPAFRAYVDSNQTITSGSQQKVTFGTENFDTNSNFASSRFTPTLEGYYQFNAVVRIGGTATTGECMLVLYKNGSEYARGTNEAGTEQGASFYSMMVSDIAYANGTTDYFEVYIQQTSGGDRTTTAGSAISHFSGCMIRGA
jgi:hypothetical protein